MTRRSIRLRLLLFAGGVMAIALVVTGFGLTNLFSRHLERRVGQELDSHIAQLAGALRYGADGRLSLAHEPADPRFARIFGGLYWQIDDLTAKATLRSRSLWDDALELNDDRLEPGAVHVHEVAGPGSSTLLVHEQLILVGVGEAEHQVRVAVAVDRRELDELEAGFARDVAPALLLLGLVLLVGFAVQIAAGLRPMDTVRRGLGAIRGGRRKRLDGDVPDEIAPLVQEINALLDSQEQSMVRARDRAADLAHGLKTPLTALAADVARLRAKETAIADDIEELAARMGRHMERELARARIRHGRPGASPLLAPAVAAVLRTLARTPAGETIDLRQDVPSGLRVAADADDLADIVGNIAENAVRHARSAVSVTAAARNGRVHIAIGDDGPGLGEAERDAVVARGERLDRAGPGAGLGLAIVQDILAAYGSEPVLERSDLGGLSVSFTLPAPPQ